MPRCSRRRWPRYRNGDDRWFDRWCIWSSWSIMDRVSWVWLVDWWVLICRWSTMCWSWSMHRDCPRTFVRRCRMERRCWWTPRSVFWCRWSVSQRFWLTSSRRMWRVGSFVWHRVNTRPWCWMCTRCSPTRRAKKTFKRCRILADCYRLSSTRWKQRWTTLRRKRPTSSNYWQHWKVSCRLRDGWELP